MMKGIFRRSLDFSWLTFHRKPAEYMPFDDTYNPTIHRINQAVRERAIYPDQELSAPAPMLRQFQNPPESLISETESKLKKLVAVADVKQGMLGIVLLCAIH